MLCPFCLIDVRFAQGPPPSCPECGEPVPTLYVRDYESCPPVVLSMVGLSGHGKTVFLASLLYELDRIHSRWPNFSYQPLDESGMKTLEEAQTALARGNLPQSSPKVFPRPVILRLDGVPQLNSCHLLLYDTAGEVFERKAELLEYGRYALRSPYVVWLLSLTEGELRHDLLKLLTVYADTRAEDPTGDRPQTLLLVLTKTDRLRDRPDLPEAFQELLSGRSDATPMSTEERQKISGALLNWLEQQSEFTNIVRRARHLFHEVACTAVSALGSDPQGQDQNISVAPRAVLQPLLWAAAPQIQRHRETAGERRQPSRSPLTTPPPPPPGNVAEPASTVVHEAIPRPPLPRPTAPKTPPRRSPAPWIAGISLLVLLAVIVGLIIANQDSDQVQPTTWSGGQTQPPPTPLLTERTHSFGSVGARLSVPTAWDMTPSGKTDAGQTRRRYTYRSGTREVFVEFFGPSDTDGFNSFPSRTEAEWISRNYRSYARIAIDDVNVNSRTALHWSFFLMDSSGSFMNRRDYYYFLVGDTGVCLGFVAPRSDFDDADSRFFRDVRGSFSIF